MVYIFDDLQLIEESNYDKLFRVVSNEREERIKRYRRNEDKVLSAVVYILLCYGLYQEHNILLDRTNIFELNEHGKPSLSFNQNIHFNLSHCSEGGVCAIDVHNIGIDIQNPIKDSSSLVNRICSPMEKVKIGESLDKESAFIRVWSCKEAFLKYNGTGINDNLTQIDFSNFEDSYYEKYNLKFTIIKSNDYTVSICGNEYITDDKIYKLTYSELMTFVNKLDRNH